MRLVVRDRQCPVLRSKPLGAAGTINLSFFSCRSTQSEIKHPGQHLLRYLRNRTVSWTRPEFRRGRDGNSPNEVAPPQSEWFLRQDGVQVRAATGGTRTEPARIQNSLPPTRR